MWAILWPHRDDGGSRAISTARANSSWPPMNSANQCISAARDMATADVKAPMEPELGSMPTPFEKEGADRVVVGETNRAVEGLGGLMRTIPLPQQVSANGPVGLVEDHGVCIDLIQQRQSGLSTMDCGMRSRARHGSAD